MEIADYPKNEEILKQRQAVLELEATNDWGAVKIAREDLYGMIKEKEKWIKENT